MGNITNMTSDFGGWLAQVPVLSVFGGWLALFPVLRDVVEADTIMDVIFSKMFFVTIVCITLAKLHKMIQENEEDNFEGYEADEKIKTFKRKCQALKMIEAIHYNLNIRGYREMILGRYPLNIIGARMQSTILLLAEMKANMNYVLKMKEMEFPLIRDIIEEEEIPDEVEVGDAVALIILLKANLGLYARDLLYGQSIYPTSVARWLEEVKQNIKTLAEQIMLVDDYNASKNMMKMLRIGKLMLLLNELEQLENLMREKTSVVQEFVNLHRRRTTPAQAQ